MTTAEAILRKYCVFRTRMSIDRSFSAYQEWKATKDPRTGQWQSLSTGRYPHPIYTVNFVGASNIDLCHINPKKIHTSFEGQILNPESFQNHMSGSEDIKNFWIEPKYGKEYLKTEKVLLPG